MNNKNIFVGVIVVVLIIIGVLVYGAGHSGRVGAVSNSGSYFNDQNASTITFAPLTGTSTSLLNNGSSDRAVTSIVSDCTTVGTSQTFTTGVGLANWTMLVATTSVSGLGLQGSANYIGNYNLATTTGYNYNATSTEGVITFVSRIWPVNTYLTFNFNATNTASCAVGANWISL